MGLTFQSKVLWDVIPTPGIRRGDGARPLPEHSENLYSVPHIRPVHSSSPFHSYIIHEHVEDGATASHFFSHDMSLTHQGILRWESCVCQARKCFMNSIKAESDCSCFASIGRIVVCACTTMITSRRRSTTSCGVRNPNRMLTSMTSRETVVQHPS